MIKFTRENEQPKFLRFGNVALNQFFTDKYGRLCQRGSFDQYVIMADEDGTPKAGSGHMEDDEPVLSIESRIVKIDWPGRKDHDQGK